MKNKQSYNDFSFNTFKNHVVIGPNGSGKSFLLRKIAEDSISKGDNVIAIAPSLYDKFTHLRGRNYNFIGARLGKSLVKKCILNFLNSVSENNLSLLKRVTSTLEYLGFSGEIGVKLNGIYSGPVNVDMSHPGMKDVLEAEELLLKLSSHRKVHDEIAWISMKEYSFNEISKSFLLTISRHEKTLKKTGILKSIDYFLRKNGQEIPLLSASSGELTFILSIIFICTHIEENSVILIDEPETSLHPKWQKEYLTTLLDLFHYWEPRIVIATHSPIMVSGIESDIFKNKIMIHGLEGSSLNNDYATKNESIEQTMWEKFNLLTPQSNYLSNLTVELINKLSKKEIGLDEFKKQMNQFKEQSYDSVQQKALEDMLLLGQKVVEAIDD